MQVLDDDDKRHGDRSNRCDDRVEDRIPIWKPAHGLGTRTERQRWREDTKRINIGPFGELDRKPLGELMKKIDDRFERN